MRKSVVIPATLVLVVLVLAACGSAPQEPVQLTGTTCEQLARSYGAEVERGQMEIVERPWDIEKDPSRFDELSNARLAVARALDDMWDPAAPPVANCSPERFLSLVERELGPRFRTEVPPAYFDVGGEADWPWLRGTLRADIEAAMSAQQ